MPFESPFPPPFPQILGGGGGVSGRVDVQARVVCVSK